ncbi:type VI secretion system Vgr family protein [Dyella terrae]|uniref:type VI secretion system Vgr family protein n=1 Tax=Dyella terrae TaxID=522259 RepID=UPI001EFC949F|nr:type VI secretion system tip protein VgrG [Dyella terrae]ULU23585.1 type VI secretion system tip protein VgrG [Dyella terrae]
MSRSADVRFTFTPAASSTAFEVVSFGLEESLSADGLPSADGAPLPYRLSVELSSFDDNVDFSTLLDAPAHFAIWRDGQVVRHVHGIVTAWDQADSGTHRTRYSAVLEPALARLTLRSNCRIFQQLSVPDIIGALLKEHGLLGVEWNLSGTHLPREFACQWNESDWAFVQRISADEGILLSIEHEANQHRLIFTDTTQSLPKGGALIYEPQAGGTADQPSLRKFRYSQRMAPTSTVGREYTFWNAKYNLEHQAAPYASEAKLGRVTSDDEVSSEYASSVPSTSGASGGNYERYRYPADYKKDEVGKPFTRTRLNAERREAAQAFGAGDAAFLVPGTSYTLEGHPRDAWDREWLAVRIHHEGTQHPSQGEDATEGATTYSNTVVFVVREFEWKAPLWPKPRMDGPLIATVVGPANEEVWVDKWGRIKLQFPWDRDGKSNEASSCWVRVAKGWAGVAYGMQALPRVGHEVVVVMLAGDIDQPMVVAAAHHPGNPPPYELPKFHAIHTVKSKELKGNRGNELRIDDTSQQISAALMSDHGATALHLGYLTHPRPRGGAPRGEGFELRTDEHGAVRAAKGLFLSTDGQAKAEGGQLSRAELVQCLESALELAKQLGDYAGQHQGLSHDAQPQQNLSHAVRDLGHGANDEKAGASGGQPLIALSSPAGIAAGTPQSITLAAGQHIDSVAQQNQQFTAGQTLTMNAGQGLGLFAHGGELKHIAHQGDLSLQAQQTNVRVEAKQSVEFYATDDHILGVAKKHVTFMTTEGAYVKLDGPDIEFGCPGSMRFKAASYDMEGAGSMHGELPQFDVGDTQRRFVALMAGSDQPMAKIPYKMRLANGELIEGTTDAGGATSQLQKGAMHLVQTHLFSPAQAQITPSTGVSSLAQIKQDGAYSQQFLLQDERDGSPLAGYPYTVTTADGQNISGVADAQGYTQPIFTDQATDVSVAVYDIAQPLNPMWDQLT